MNDAASDLLKTFESSFQNFRHHDYRTVFKDLCRLGALAVANMVRTDIWQEREDEYLRLINSYAKEAQTAIVDLHAQLVLALVQNPYHDLLGEVYTRLEIGNKRLAQYFTPPQVSYMMAAMQLNDAGKTIKREGFISIYDPCVGPGGMFMAAARFLSEKDLAPDTAVAFVGQDIDRTCCDMAVIQLFYNNLAAKIQCGDSILYRFSDTIVTPQWITTGLGERFAMSQMRKET